MAGDEDEDINVDVTLEDYLSGPAKSAAESAEDMAREIRKLNRQLLMLDRRATKAAASVGILDAAMARFSGRTMPQMSAQLDGINKGLSKYSSNAKKAERPTRQLGKAWDKARRSGQAFIKMLRGIATAAKIAAIGVGILTIAVGALGLVGVLVVAVQAIFQVGAALLQLGGFAAILPTAFGVLIASVAALIIGFKGFGDAMEAAMSGDFAEFQEALKKLSPSAQKFFKIIRKWAPVFKKARKAIQEEIFKPLKKELEPLLIAVVDDFVNGLQKVAREWGLLFAQIMQFFRSLKGQQLVRDLFEGAQLFVSAVGGGLKEILEGFADVVHEMKITWQIAMNGMENQLIRFGDWLSRISKNGKLNRWIDNAILVFDQLGESLGLIGQIFSDITKAAGGASMMPLITFLQVIQDFTGSPEGQKALASFFKSIRETLKALAPVLPPLAVSFGLLARALADIIIGLTPGLVVFFQTLAVELAKISEKDPDFWQRFGRSIGELLIVLAELLPVIVPWLEKIIGWLSTPGNLQAVLLIAAAIWAVITAIGIVAPLIGSLAAIAGALGISLGAVILIFIAIIIWIVLVVGFLWLLWRNWDKIVNMMSIAWTLFEDNVLKPFGQFFLDNVVTPIVDTIETIRKALTDPWETASRIIHGIIDGIIGRWEGAVGNIQGAISRVQGGLNRANPFSDQFFLRAAGGPVAAGKDYMVGEIGKEMYVPDYGSPKMVGEGGPTMMDFPGDGYIVPNYMLKAMDRASAGMAKQLSAMESGPSDADLRALVHAAAAAGGDTNYNTTINFPAGDKYPTPYDIQKAVERAMSNIESDRKERS